MSTCARVCVCVCVDRTVIIILAITAAAMVNEHAAGSDGCRAAHEPAGKTGDGGGGILWVMTTRGRARWRGGSIPNPATTRGFARRQ